MKKSLLPALLSCLLFGHGYAEDVVEPSNRVLLYLDDIALTESMYRQHFAQKGYELPADPEQQKSLQTTVVNELVNILLMSREATRLGLDKTPEMQLQMEVARNNLLGKALVGQYLEEIAVDEASLQGAYQEINAEADRRAEYLVSHILLSDEKKAQELAGSITSETVFADYARQYSEDSSADAGGDLGWVTGAMLEPELADALIELKPGQVSEKPVKSRFGWHIIQVREVRRQDVPPLQEIEGKLTQLIQQRRLMEKIESLRKQAVIKKPEDKMKELPGIK